MGYLSMVTGSVHPKRKTQKELDLIVSEEEISCTLLSFEFFTLNKVDFDAEFSKIPTEYRDCPPKILLQKKGLIYHPSQFKTQKRITLFIGLSLLARKGNTQLHVQVGKTQITRWQLLNSEYQLKLDHLLFHLKKLIFKD